MTAATDSFDLQEEKRKGTCRGVADALPDRVATVTSGVLPGSMAIAVSGRGASLAAHGPLLAARALTPPARGRTGLPHRCVLGMVVMNLQIPRSTSTGGFVSAGPGADELPVMLVRSPPIDDVGKFSIDLTTVTNS